MGPMTLNDVLAALGAIEHGLRRAVTTSHQARGCAAAAQAYEA